MFTGLIETLGTLHTIERGNRSLLFGIVPKLIPFEVSLGDSVAINGVCLTIEKISGKELYLRAVEETIRRSVLGTLQSESVVNMERALLATSRFDGHLVQGHVDGRARLVQIEPRGDAKLYSFSLAPEFLRFVAEKGSVSLDGISLTVSAVGADRFTVSLIPHTIQETNLAQLQVGKEVNFECDVLARYVDRLMQFRGSSTTKETQGSDMLSLMERNGF